MTLLEGISAVLIGLGVLLMLFVLVSVFRMDFAVNRMHVTTIADTLATLLIFAGGVVANGFAWIDVKLVLILGIQWISAPVCGHLIAQMEYSVAEDLSEHCEEEIALNGGRKEEKG